MLLDAVICETEVLASDTKLFRIRPTRGEDWVRAEPGSHIDVNCFGELTRQYSLFDLDEAGYYTIAVKRSERAGGISEALHTTAVAGTRLRISKPRNRFPLGAPAHAVLLAAGIGITPIYSMQQQLRAYGVGHHLHFFKRDAKLFRDRLAAAISEGAATLYEGMSSEQIRATLYEILDVDHAPNTHVFACGPAGFMDAVIEIAGRRLPTTHVHIERFQPISGASDGQQRQFEVVLARSGVTCRVAQNETILDALAKCSVKVDASCREGVCGACVTRVLDGTPDHRDSFLTDAEKLGNEDVCLCVSRSHTPTLVLDL
ncbi:oxidoreductase [Rhizobium lentis]|uniref:PDR/VanB family oxidoreductase n=1 Tax=Rhizobium lentis TaxID=1138194 RepID=UPI001C8390ED|nr:PDR/VanB family oxidoreductase [Rhizobium lentis]MBX5041311.1 oxidoreductase [Rhizobium lentis]MBX5071567.1 oxidoreductase [Rhizobium lentis]MBX5108395.1 oxidoreductase [Rhizobium lentis]MBX5117369.1 oxidoreductase [Rhizobium lentis]MBX5141323.1 oxidoreductase [Rhizobium lentis]